MAQNIDFSAHVLMALLKLRYEVDCFTQDFPFAGLHPTIRWQLVS